MKRDIAVVEPRLRQTSDIASTIPFRSATSPAAPQHQFMNLIGSHADQRHCVDLFVGKPGVSQGTHLVLRETFYLVRRCGSSGLIGRDRQDLRRPRTSWWRGTTPTRISRHG